MKHLLRFRGYCRHLPTFLSAPVFVKVGANDGITGDPCSDILLANKKWHGLFIEPVPYCFDKLHTNFPDPQRFSFERVAIGSSTGKTTFYYVNANARECIPSLPRWFNQLGSFDRSHIVKHLNGILEPFIVESTVQVCPLADVLMRHNIRDVHLLHIDTEGYDYEVLKSLDFSKYAPLLIFVEHKHLSTQQRSNMYDLLHGYGYRISDCGCDYFALNVQGLFRVVESNVTKHA